MVLHSLGSIKRTDAPSPIYPCTYWPLPWLGVEEQVETHVVLASGCKMEDCNLDRCQAVKGNPRGPSWSSSQYSQASPPARCAHHPCTHARTHPRFIAKCQPSTQTACPRACMHSTPANPVSCSASCVQKDYRWTLQQQQQ